MPPQQSASVLELSDHEPDPDGPCLFEVEHGDTVIRIADDWDGHVLVEKLYAALRKARQARDQATPLKEAGSVTEDKLSKSPAT